MPHGHWKTTTFVAGLRLTGLVAPFVLDGPINRDAFEVYAEKVLVSELSPGDVVDIIEAAYDAWRKLIAQPNTITPIGTRQWALTGQT